ncbi:MAG: hypothetical protein EHM28_06195 [Spirochaetaceae bacterium]|nr:MAG: hypothetical protein EHM28_06195 [Spirochaetaceae bacterium]
MTIAYLSNPTTPYIGTMIAYHGIWEVVSGLDINLLWYRGGRHDTPGDYEKEANLIFNFIDKQQVDGIIIAPVGFRNFFKSKDSFMGLINMLAPLPIVASGGRINGIPSVIPDSYDDILKMTEHLVTAHNRRNVAFLRGPESSETANDRYRAYCDALARHDMKLKPELVIGPLEWDLARGHAVGGAAVTTLLDEREVKFDAIVASNDRLAIGACAELEKRGIDIPDDVAVTGYDDSEEGRHLVKPLTSVPHPQYQINREAVYLLVDLIAGKKIPMTTPVRSEILYRRSCGCDSSPIRDLEAAFEKRNQSSRTPVVTKTTGHENKIGDAEVSFTRHEAVSGGILPADSLRIFFRAFSDGVRNEKCRPFLDALDCLVNRSEKEQVYAGWQRATSAARDILLDLLPGKLEMIDDFAHLVRVRLHEFSLHSQYRVLSQRSRLFGLTHLIIQSINRAYSLETLNNIMCTEMNQLGVRIWYLALFDSGEGSGEPSWQIFGRNAVGPVVKQIPGREFWLGNLLQGEALPELGKYRLFIGPLYTHENQMGLLIIEIKTEFVYIYEAIRTQVSSTLWSILLLERYKATASTLQKKAAELIRSNQELEQFAYVASHDLQEPLRKIIVFNDRLDKTYAKILGQQENEDATRLRKAVTRMQSLITSLLEYSRVSSKMGASKRVKLSELAEEVKSDLEQRILASSGTVQIGQLPEIDADPVQMRRLLQNLISNALKFHRKDTPPIVRVYVAKTSDSSFELVVQDNGIGIEKEFQERIFRIFERLHAQGEYEGSGIGLAVCQKIADRHGGSIRVESEPGKGARFIVTLPGPITQQLP